MIGRGVPGTNREKGILSCPHYADCLDHAAKKQCLDCSGCEYGLSRHFSLDIADHVSRDPFPDYYLPYGLDL